jgi:RsiW-degrading membrane proteinase PrsW (M82 family)
MNKKSKGMGLGIALGAALGAALGVAAGHLAIWLAIGVAIGVAIGGNVRRKGIDCPECAAVHREHEATEMRQQSKR